MMPRRRSPGHRRSVALLALIASVSILASACGSAEEVVVYVTTTPAAPQASAPAVTAPLGDTAASDQSAPPASGDAQAPASSAAPQLAGAIRITAKPAFGAQDVGPADPVVITVFSAKITDMTVTGDDGSEVAGKVDDGGSTFSLTGRMAYGVTYTFAGTATAPDNSTKAIKGSLSTVNPKKTTQALIQIPEGGTVGVGAPIIVSFCPAVQDKAAAQKALAVTTSRGKIEGSWGWVQDEDFSGLGVCSQAHYRTKDYWPANTKVTVQANLQGVNYGNGWGREDVTRKFTVGRSLVMIATVSTKRLVVMKDGQIWRDYPVSYGAESEPGKTTVSGIHIVQEKYPVFNMTNPQFNYYNRPEKWAIRINNNGEFIHHNAATEAKGLLGKENVSHGCVNMGEANAKELYDTVIYGDPVDVEGTTAKMSAKDAVYDWSYSWEDWRSLSALG